MVNGGSAAKLDVSEIRNVLSNVERLLSSHEGEPLRAPFGRPGSTIGRDLRLARDYLQLACAELSAMCWFTEGQDDLRRPTGSRPGGDTNSRCGTAPSRVGTAPVRIVTAPSHIDLRQHTPAH